MEFEQIVKLLDWLEKQQRENKETISALSEQFNSFQSSVDVVTKMIKTLEKQVAEIMPAGRRIDQFETMISKQRTEIIRLIDENQKSQTKSLRDIEKRTQEEDSEIHKAIGALKMTINLSEIKKQIKERSDETQRVLNNVSDLKTRIDDAKRSSEDVQHTLKASEETRKNDLKRVVEIQGELTSLRQRIDENREKTVTTADSIRSVETRFSELLASELERKQSQAAFVEQQTIAQIDRDRAWKDWKEKYEIFQRESQALDVLIQKLDDTLRGAKKAQETYLELNTRLERRINEVTEMQRLAEDRLRQEWVSFKADDQKRWTGYNLSSEESLREIRKEVKKHEQRYTSLTDNAQVLQDQMQQTTSVTEAQLQEMMNVVHEWLTSYQRVMGHGKKSGKK